MMMSLSKGMTLSVVTLAFALEPATGEPDLLKYAITQGGLLAVVLVLLWSYRKDSLGALQLERERTSELIELVASTREAITKSVDMVSAQAQSIERLTRVIEQIEQRRSPRD